MGRPRFFACTFHGQTMFLCLVLFFCMTLADEEEIHGTMRVSVHRTHHEHHRAVPTHHAPEQQEERYFLHELDDNGGINSGQGYSHQVHAIACAMVEARHLGRTLILPDKLLLEKKHSFTAGGDGFKMLHHVLNVSLLESYVPILLVKEPNTYAQKLVIRESRTMLVAPISTTIQELESYNFIDIVMRPHRWHYIGWFESCLTTGMLRDLYYQETPKLMALFRPVDHVLDAAHSIIHELGGRYCALHVRRGDKLKEVEGLDAATQPDAIVASIKHLCKSGRALYIGSNEADASFFEPLKEHYTLFTYRDFAHLLEPAGFVRRTDMGVDIIDNFGMYQAEVEIMLNGSPFMDTFCVLMKEGSHLGCNMKELAGRNSGYYGVPDLGLIGG